jgi:hypothetical protein
MDLRAFREGVSRMTRDEATQLRDALTRATQDEPTHRQMQQGVPLVDRMRSPATVFARQVRLEKLRILDEALAACRSERSEESRPWQ